MFHQKLRYPLQHNWNHQIEDLQNQNYLQKRKIQNVILKANNYSKLTDIKSQDFYKKKANIIENKEECNEEDEDNNEDDESI